MKGEGVLHFYDFNSIKVQLKPHFDEFIAKTLLHFNSIKVQLKLGYEEVDPRYLTFQFHKGTIKASRPSNTAQCGAQISIP